MERAFVVQLPRRPDPEHGVFAGRIEHVDSGCSTHFQTLQEFLAFISSCFAPAAGAAGETEDPASQEAFRPPGAGLPS